MKKIVLTGDRPTGNLHLGHYVGSLKKRVEMQKDYMTYIIIADFQALTDYFDQPSIIFENVYALVYDYLSCGIDPNLSKIFIQSHVGALLELSMYFMNIVSLARVQRNPTVKAELASKKMKNDVHCGFVFYPVSQAADITAFKADFVPVGVDQAPMIEQTNEIVRNFNRIYVNSPLKECKMILSDTSKLLGIDGKAKASKSLDNCIFLNDASSVVRQKVFNMYTDPDHIKISDPGRVEGNIVFHYLDVFYENKEHLLQLKTDYAKGGLGDIFLKELLFKVLEEILFPIREKRREIQIEDVKNIICEGNKAAKTVADQTLHEVKEAMRLNY